MAFTAETLGALRMCHAVAELVVVSPDPDLRGLATEFQATFVQSDERLDVALNNAAQSCNPAQVQMVATVVGNLPALQRREVEQIFSEVGRRRRPAYAIDLKGSGVTFYADLVGDFDACLEDEPIRQLTERGAEQVGELLGGLRCDVDSCESMRIAAYIGMGPRAEKEFEAMSERISRVARMVAST